MFRNSHRKIPSINKTHKKYIKKLNLLTTRQKIIRYSLYFLVILFLYDGSFFIINPKPLQQDNQSIAIWMEHTWSQEKHPDGIIREMAQNLKHYNITDAYFHVGPLNKDGIIELEKYERARALVAQVKKYHPNIKLYAWFSQITYNDDGPFDIKNEMTRQNMVQTTESFIDMGFDGVHLDLEPIYTDDVYYLNLLNHIHYATFQRGKILSVSAMRPAQTRLIEWVYKAFTKYPGYWSKKYFTSVSEQVDHMVVQTFDSRLHTPALYGRLVKWITKWTGRNISAKVFIGISTSDRFTRSHNPIAENIKAGLKGYNIGKNKLTIEQQNNIGLAIYGEWTTDRFDFRKIKKIYDIE